MADDLASIERDIYGIHPEPVTCERCEAVVPQEDMEQLPQWALWALLEHGQGLGLKFISPSCTVHSGGQINIRWRT